jgi:hypothetical protein
MLDPADYQRLTAEMQAMTTANAQALNDWARGDLSDAAYRILRQRNNQRFAEIQAATKGRGPLFPPLRWQEHPGAVTYTPHPLAEIFPLLEGVPFAELCDDIKRHGQQQPIVIHGDRILDGRNRLKACIEMGIPPAFVEFDCLGLTCSIEEYVWSVNNHRRHLTGDQRAAIAQTWKEHLARDAKLRQSAAGGNRKPLVAESPQAVGVLPAPDEPLASIQTETLSERITRVLRETSPRREKRRDTTRQTMAKQANVTEHKIKLADQVAATRPDLVPQVATGKLRLAEAARIAHPKVDQPRQDTDAAVKDDKEKFGRAVKTRLSSLAKDQHRDYLVKLQAELNKFFRAMSGR